jgi:hypothetical protein
MEPKTPDKCSSASIIHGMVINDLKIKYHVYNFMSRLKYNEYFISCNVNFHDYDI